MWRGRPRRIPGSRTRADCHRRRRSRRAPGWTWRGSSRRPPAATGSTRTARATPLGRSPSPNWPRRYHPDLRDYLFQPVVAASSAGTRAVRRRAVRRLLPAVGPATTWRTYRDGMDTLAAAAGRPDLDVGTGIPVRRGRRRADTPAVTTDAGDRHRAGGRAVRPRPGRAAPCTPTPTGAERVSSPRARSPRCSRSAACWTGRSARSPSRPLYALLVPAVEEKVLSGRHRRPRQAPGRAPAGRGLITLSPRPPRSPSCSTRRTATSCRRLLGAGRRLPAGAGRGDHRHPRAPVPATGCPRRPRRRWRCGRVPAPPDPPGRVRGRLGLPAPQQRGRRPRRGAVAADRVLTTAAPGTEGTG